MNFLRLPALCALALTISVASGATFSNLGPITISDSGAANPYPSTINVTGMGSIVSVTVDLFGLSHTWPDDLQALLVSPSGTPVLLMANAGSGFDITAVNLTFDDAALSSLPDSGQIVSGVYQTSIYGTTQDFSVGGGGAPAPPYQTPLASLIGQGADGIWSLYIYDDVSGDSGSLSGGWALNINDAPAAIPEPATTAMVVAGLALCALGIRRRKS